MGVLLMAQALAPTPASATEPAPRSVADCDDACLATGAWSQTVPGVDAGIAIGQLLNQQNGTWTINTGDQTLAITPALGAQVWVPSDGLGFVGLDPKHPVEGTRPVPGIDRWWAPGQPVRVSGGAPGTFWTGDVQLRLNWWEGPEAFTYQQKAIATPVELGALTGIVVGADNEGVTVNVGGHIVWLAVYPNTLIGQLLDRVSYDVADGIAPVTDGQPYDPVWLQPGDRILAWFERDVWSSTNPLVTPAVDLAASCPRQAGEPGCRWEATRIYLRPGTLPDDPRPWWERGTYEWSNVNPTFGVNDIWKACMFEAEAVGTVVAVDPGRSVQILANSTLVSMAQPPSDAVPLAGEVVRLHGGGCIANGQIQRPVSVDIAPRPPGGLVGIAHSAHRLALTVDPANAGLSDSRTIADKTWRMPVTRVTVAAKLDGAAVAPVAGTLQLVVSDVGWLEAAAPGALTVSEAERRTLDAGAGIGPWSLRILRRPPAGTTRDLTLTAYFIEKASGAFAIATATLRLQGGSYPQPTPKEAETSALLVGAQAAGVPDGVMLALGGGTIELTVRPDGLASGGGVFNYKGFSCDAGDLCSAGVLDIDLPKTAGLTLPDVISVKYQGLTKVAVTMSAGKGAITWLYRHPAVLAGERWAGVGLSVAGFVYDKLGLGEICGTGSISKDKKPGLSRAGILSFLRVVGLNVSCELPDFGIQYITLATDDPLAASTGAYGMGSFADLSIGLSVGVSTPATTDGRILSLAGAVRAVRLDQCGSDPSASRATQQPALPIPYGEKALATSTADPCVAQLDPEPLARILAHMALDPSSGPMFFPNLRDVLGWLAAADPNNAENYAKTLESFEPWASAVRP